MQIEFIKKILPTLRKNIFIESISLKNRNEGILLSSLSPKDEPEILKLLNSIANQNITSIDVYRYSYTINNIELYYEDLSTAERLFLLSYAANKAKKKTFFCNDILQLSTKTLIKYIRYFKDSEYVNFVYKEESMKDHYDVVLEEAGLC